MLNGNHADHNTEPLPSGNSPIGAESVSIDDEDNKLHDKVITNKNGDSLVDQSTLSEKKSSRRSSRAWSRSSRRARSRSARSLLDPDDDNFGDNIDIQEDSFAAHDNNQMTNSLASMNSSRRSSAVRSMRKESYVERVENKDKHETLTFAYTSQADSVTEKIRDNLVYLLGCDQILSPRPRDLEADKRLEGQAPESGHVLRDISCLVGKYILLYIASSSSKDHELKKVLEEFIESDEAGSQEFVVLYLCTDIDSEESVEQNDKHVIKHKQKFEEFLKLTRFFAIPFDLENTRSSLLREFNEGTAYLFGFTNKRSRVIVINPQLEILTTWGRACLIYNRDECVQEWKEGFPGISSLQYYWAKYISNSSK